MIYLVALVEPFTFVGIVALAFRFLRGQERAHARREDLILNQLLNSVGKPWQPAPADERTPEPEPEPRLYAISPDQAASPLN